MSFTLLSLPVLAARIPGPADWAPEYPDVAETMQTYVVVTSGMIPGKELT